MTEKTGVRRWHLRRVLPTIRCRVVYVVSAATDADTGEEAVIWTPYPFADVPQVLRLRQKVLPFLRGIEWRAEGQVRTIAEHEGLMGCH